MEQQKQDPFLFILLGFDTLYSINLNHLLQQEEEEADLPIVFSHKTHIQPGSGYPYPLGMGLFVHDSKLHFFGGENINADNGFQDIDFETGKPQEELDYLALHFLHRKNYEKNWGNWINKKVFSFTPVLKSDAALSLVCSTEEEDNNDESNTPLIPEPSSYKMRPIVFTFSDKVYALATRPFLDTLIDAGIEEEQDLFEVFESKINEKGQWTKLLNPPSCLNRLIHGSGHGSTTGLSRSTPIFHCVIKNQLLLQCCVGDFIFDLNLGEWFQIPYEDHEIILASLEYKNQVLLCFSSGYLVAYDLESFEEYKKGLSFWKSSFGAIWEETIFNIESITEDSSIWGASLSIVDDNSICLVFNSFDCLYVCYFEFSKHTYQFDFKAYKKVYLPHVMQSDPYNLSSFILKGDVLKSNQDSTTDSTTDVMQSDPYNLSSFILKGDVLKSNKDSTTDSTTGEWKQAKRTKSRFRRGRRGLA